MHIFDIIGHPRNQPADGVARKKIKRQILNMRKKLHPQIMHDYVSAVFHDYFLRKVEDEIEQNHRQKDCGHQADPV